MRAASCSAVLFSCTTYRECVVTLRTAAAALQAFSNCIGSGCELMLWPQAFNAATLTVECARMQVKGNCFKNKRVLMEAVHDMKSEKAIEKNLQARTHSPPAIVSHLAGVLRTLTCKTHKSDCVLFTTA
jgi:hypothetical protein